MEREDGEANFSPDDPENVSIPESLGPVAWEFFGAVNFLFKKMENLALILDCLEYLKAVQTYNKNFLRNERRFEKLVFPSIKNYYSTTEKVLSRLDFRILIECYSIVSDLQLEESEVNKSFLIEVRELSKKVINIIPKDIEDQLLSNLKEYIGKFVNKFE